MTNNNVELEINLFEELSDADLMAVVGGDLTGTVLGGVADANNGIGNGGTPTTGLLHLVGDTLTAAGTYVNNVANGAELGLQAVNGTVTGVAGQV